MPNASLFSGLGLFVDEHFLDLESCKTIRNHGGVGDSALAGVQKSTGESGVDTGVRRVQQTRLPRPLRGQLRTQLLSIQSLLEAHFETRLEGAEDPALLTYRPGDFYHPHRDGSEDPHMPEYLQRRRISVIVFLNTETDTPGSGSYCGGAVVFYGLVKKEGCEKYGLSLNGRAGVLVAFRSDIWHEVQPVTSGQRCTVVSWYYR